MDGCSMLFPTWFIAFAPSPCAFRQRGAGAEQDVHREATALEATPKSIIIQNLYILYTLYIHYIYIIQTLYIYIYIIYTYIIYIHTLYIYIYYIHYIDIYIMYVYYIYLYIH